MPVIDEKFILQQVESNVNNISSETVLIFPERGQIKVINETGRMIWDLIDGKSSIGVIVDQIEKNYSIPRSQAEIDVLSFINLFIERKIIKILSNK